MQSQSCARENQEHLDISQYWNDRRAALPRLAGHALRALDVPRYPLLMQSALSVTTINLCASAECRCLMNLSRSYMQQRGMATFSGRLI